MRLPLPTDPSRPRSLTDLFVSFTLLALQDFGGVLAMVQRELVEKKRWMTREEFIEDWAVAQIMPGPNVVNLVDQQHWRSDAQFNASIAIAQAAPGPNVLFVALLGWNIGLNAGGLPTGLLGVLLSLLGILIPGSVLTYAAAHGATATADCAPFAPSSRAWRPSSWRC